MYSFKWYSSEKKLASPEISPDGLIFFLMSQVAEAYVKMGFIEYAGEYLTLTRN